MVPQAQRKPMVDRIVTFKLSLATGARDRMVQSKGLLRCKAFGNLWLDKGKGKSGEHWYHLL